MHENRCRFCGEPLIERVVDLGASPLANSILDATSVRRMEPTYPLHVYVCHSCYLVQLEEFENPEHIFSDYSYFSSYSDSWLDQCKRYATRMISELKLNEGSKVIEIASNDGYLLQYFVEGNVPVLGIEPAANVAKVAIEKGVATAVLFFGKDTARQLRNDGHLADLIIANNVLAHVPDINGFVAGLKQILKPQGTITVEFPHLLNLLERVQFDTIYHEHFSYLSLGVVQKIFSRHGITIFDVEEIASHGGSLRVYARHSEHGSSFSPRVTEVLRRETVGGLNEPHVYRAFQQKVRVVKVNLLRFLIDTWTAGKVVAGYGAPAKGNTLLNYCGVGPEFVPFTVDRSVHKQGKLLPGTRIPILAPTAIFERKPDYVLILPWNLKDEIVDQMKAIRAWGGKFVVPLPTLEIF